MAPAGTAPVLPAAAELRAEPGWRAVDFVSDLHLSEALPRTAKALCAHLRHTPADAVLILGDLFELWVGDDMASRPEEGALVAQLAEAASERPVFFMAGNRDFLVGPALLESAGLRGLPDPTVLVAFGQRVLLTHGDALCLADEPYQAFRREVRQPAWQQAFLARPLAERLRIAGEIRAASKTRRQFDGDSLADIDVDEALRGLAEARAGALVHGHTHRPADEPLAAGVWRHVLTDWDLDAGTRQGVLRLDAGGFTRVAPARLKA
jgi:UDP-2,3-diacylglucosamine hydrolase